MRGREDQGSLFTDRDAQSALRAVAREGPVIASRRRSNPEVRERKDGLSLALAMTTLGMPRPDGQIIF
jgi:hypothetical protein